MQSLLKIYTQEPRASLWRYVRFFWVQVFKCAFEFHTGSIITEISFTTNTEEKKFWLEDKLYAD